MYAELFLVVFLEKYAFTMATLIDGVVGVAGVSSYTY